MPQYTKSNESYRVSYITGPSHVLLGLTLSQAKPAAINIRNLGSAGKCHHGQLNLESIKESVIEGVTKANQLCGTKYYVGQIEYIENDTPNYALYTHCAYLIIKGLHEGIEFKSTAVRK